MQFLVKHFNKKFIQNTNVCTVGDVMVDNSGNSSVFTEGSDLDSLCCGKKPHLVMHNIMCLFVTFVEIFGCVD